MLIPIALTLAFVAVVMAIQGAASVLFAARDRTQRVNRRLTLLERGMTPDEVYATLVRKPTAGQLGTATPDLYDRFFLYCRQAGLAISPQRLAVYVGAGALLIWIFSLVMLSALSGRAGVVNALISLFGAVVLALVAATVGLRMMRDRRLKQLETQLPLALDIVTRAIRAGHPVVSAVQLAAQEMGDPIGSEFGLIVDETTYGLEFREALANFAHRTGSEYVHFFAVSVSIQSETGGNLAEILGNLCSVIRSMQTLHLRVRALSAEGRMSAQILSALPIGLVCFLLLTSPSFYTTKFDDPLFWPVVMVVLCWYLLGQFIVNRMVNFKY